MTPDATSRTAVRRSLDRALMRPVDEEKAKEYDREHWGLSEDAEASRSSSIWDGASYG